MLPLAAGIYTGLSANLFRPECGVIRLGASLLMPSLSYIVSWSKLTSLCVVIYGIIDIKGHPAWEEQSTFLLCALRT